MTKQPTEPAADKPPEEKGDAGAAPKAAPVARMSAKARKAISGALTMDELNAVVAEIPVADRDEQAIYEARRRIVRAG